MHGLGTEEKRYWHQRPAHKVYYSISSLLYVLRHVDNDTMVCTAQVAVLVALVVNGQRRR